MTRVLLVTNDFPPKPGGIQQYLSGLVAALDAEIRVLAPADPDAGDEPGVFRGRRRFMWATPSVRRWVIGHVAEFAPDVVLFGAPHPLQFLGPRLRRETGTPYAVLCHGAEVTIPAAFPGARQLLRRPLRRADVVFAVSQFTRGRVERLTKRPVRYVGAGVGAEFSPAAKRPEGVIGCVSRFVPRKGQRRVLRAAAGLRDEGRDVSVLLVGRGRDESRLRSLATTLGVPTRFEVDVPYQALPGLYREMTLFAMPTRSRWMGLEAEGLGIVFLEAAASGLPVVAGDSGGSPETVAPGRTGFVVDGEVPLIDALRRLLDDPQVVERMGAAGRERAVEEFSWGAVADRFSAGFAEAVGEAHP
jgi:phosphatidylinositol alpha-1,6-mannosyltransferase